MCEARKCKAKGKFWVQNRTAKINAIVCGNHLASMIERLTYHKAGMANDTIVVLRRWTNAHGYEIWKG